MRQAFFALAAAAAVLSGCDSPNEVDARPYEVELRLDRNYQAVYAGMLATMRRCVRPGTGYFLGSGATTLDAQLYPDLGYGEIRHGISGIVPQTYSQVRIARDGGGTKVQIKSGRGIGEPDPRHARWLSYWARSGTECPSVGRTEAPG
jgi:hypothetical protein